MSRFDHTAWDDGRGVKDLSTLGVGPLIEFVKILEEELAEDSGPRVITLLDEMSARLSDMDKCIFRLLNEAEKVNGEKRRSQPSNFERPRLRA
jgi:hypothetical protein